MEIATAVGIGLAFAFRDFFSKWLYRKPAAAIHDFLWTRVKSERLRKVLFFKVRNLD